MGHPRSYRYVAIGSFFLAAGQLCTGQARAAEPTLYLDFTSIVDGNGATSEHGYAGNSINNIAYITWNLYTVGDQQFATYYGRNPSNSSDPFNQKIIIARRDLGAPNWDILKTTLAPNTINDDHNNVNFGIDGDGYMHLSWGMHGNPYHYAVSPSPVTGTNPLSMGPDLGTMTGRESRVTYPQFYNLPDGDMLYLFREGSSGNGDFFINRYDTATDTWDNVHENAGGTNHLTFLAGSGFTPNWNSYPNRLVLDDNDRLHMTWTNRYQGDSPAGESGYQTNHNIYYGYSDDFGVSWKRMDGTDYGLSIVDPIVAGQVKANRLGDIAVAIPEGSSLINQADMAVDHNNDPIFATWYAPNASSGDHRRQYMVGFWDGDSWETRQVSDRTIDSPGSKKNESFVRDLARPTILVDDQGRLVVVYRDNQDSNGITIAHTRAYADDPDRSEWFTIDLTTENLGGYEPNHDPVMWENENKLSLLYQQQSGYGNNLTSSLMYVMEWDAKQYFASLEGDLNLDGITDQADLDILLNHWGQSVTAGLLADGDSTGDGLAGTADLELILRSWDGAAAPIYTVPEPGGLALLVGGGLALFRKTRASLNLQAGVVK